MSNIKEPSVFEPAHISEDVYIWKEIRQIAGHLSEYAMIGVPINLVVTGSKGSGKTTDIRKVSEETQKVLNVDCVYLNGRNSRTSKGISDELTGRKRRGYSWRASWRAGIERAKERLNRKHIVAIDEVDLLKDYVVLSILAEETGPDLILPRQKLFWHKQLDESLRTSLSPVQMNFRP